MTWVLQKIEEVANITFEVLGNILKNISIEEAESKGQAPSTIAVFLRVLFNTVNMTMTITEDRLTEIKMLAQEWMEKTSATLNELQQLLGKLNFICNMVRAGWVFMSCIINELKSFPINGRRRLKFEFKKDLMWWNKYIETFNGVTLIPNFNWCTPNSKVSTDSCLTGCGGVATQKILSCGISPRN